MKIILILFLMLFSAKSNAQNIVLDKFVAYPITTDYLGVAYNTKTVLLNGTNGVIMLTSDKGETWKRVYTDMFYDIEKVITVGDTYYGIFHKDFILKSVDNGFSWTYYKIDDKSNLKNIIYKNNKLYVQSELNVYEYDLNLENKKILVNNNANKMQDMAMSNNNIYFYKNGIIHSLNLQTSQQKEIDLKNIGICDSCSIDVKLFEHQNNIYFRYMKVLYQIKDNNLDKIVNCSPALYFQNASAYELTTFYDYTTNMDYIRYYRIDLSQKIKSKISDKYPEEYVNKLEFTSLLTIDANTLIAAGKGSLIAKSINNGQDWKVISTYEYDYSSNTLRDSLDLASVNAYMDIKTSNDAGIIWKPSKYIDNKYVKSKYGPFFQNAFYFKNKIFFKYTPTILIDDENFVYSNDNLTTMKKKTLSNKGLGGYMSDNWQTYEKRMFDLYADTINFYQNARFQALNYIDILKLDFEMNVVKREKYIDSATLLHQVREENGNIHLFVNYKKDPIHLGNQSYEFKNKYYAILSSSNNGASWENKFIFKLDDFHSWGSIIILSSDENHIYFSDYNKYDSLTSVSNVYQLDFKNNQVKKIFTVPHQKAYTVYVVDNKQYLFTTSTLENEYANVFFFYEKDINSDTWTQLSTDIPIISMLLNKKPNTYGNHNGIVYDIPRQRDIICNLNKISGTSVENSEILEKAHLQYTAPYPIPAQNYVKSTIYWNSVYDINQVKFSVSDVFGTTIPYHNISIEQTDTYKGILNWDCTGISTGIYFIRVQLGSETITVPVAIGK